jgi:hypothetical protein
MKVQMAKGALAKDRVLSKLQETFGSDVIGIYDKKLYVWAQDEGEKVQIAISLTCPKNPVAVTTPTVAGGFDFSGDNEVVAPSTFVPAEITQEEEDNLARMMERLGL